MKCRYIVIAVSIACAALTNHPIFHADIISHWNDTAIKVIKAAGPAGPVQSRSLALVHVAQFDAVNAVTGGYTPYLTAIAARLRKQRLRRLLTPCSKGYTRPILCPILPSPRLLRQCPKELPKLMASRWATRWRRLC